MAASQCRAPAPSSSPARRCAPPISKAGGTRIPSMALWEISLFEFIRVTVLLGGGAAWLTGRATARTWSPWWKLVLYIALLTIALRFVHFSLFEGTFFLPPEDFGTALHFAAVDFVVLLIAAAIGRQVTRAGQMARQYGFLSGREGAAG